MAKKNKKIKRSLDHRKKTKKVAGLRGISGQQQILQQALALHQAGSLPEAEALYRQILSADPDNPDALHYLGMLAHQAGKNEIAIELISRALRCRPDYVNALNNLGIILNDQGKLDEAAANYRRALALKPDYAEALNNLGGTLVSQGKLDEAIASFMQAISLKPDFAEAYYNLGNGLKDQGKLHEAVACFRRALASQPDYIAAYNTLGIALCDQGKLDEAVACFRQALTVKPDDAEAHNNLGVALSYQGKLDEAVASFTRALFLKPDYAEAQYNLGNGLKDLGQLDEAVACFRRALSLKPDYAEAHYNLGFIFSQLGKMDDAIACFSKTLSLKPDYVMAFKGLSTIVQYTAVDDVVLAMENIYNNKKEMPVADRVDLGFALGKVFEDLRDYDKSFTFILAANLLKRGSFEYSIQNEQDFFSRIKNTFSPDFFASRHGSGYLDGTPIFIVGMPRSGTTLVEQILASHPLVFGAGELTVLTGLANDICAGGAAAPFPACLPDLEGDAFTKMGSEYMEKIREHSKDAQYITDKMPNNFLHVGLIKTILPNAKVIHCMRDPMDNCFSIFKKNFMGTHRYAYDMVELGRYYNLYQDLMAHWGKVLPGFMYTIRYEEVVSDQQSQTKSLLDYCGLPWDEDCLAFHKTERKVSTASLAQVRRPLYKDSVELWKRYEKQLEPLRKAIYG